MRLSRSSAAWVQGASLIAAVAAITTAIVLESRRPFDRETLEIEADQLRSQSADTVQLVRHAAARRLAPIFVRVHAAQLADKVHAKKTTQDTTTPKPELRAAHAGAQTIARALHEALDALAADERRADLASIDSLSARSNALAEQLAPAR